MRSTCTIGLLTVILILGRAPSVAGQVAARPLPGWEPGFPTQARAPLPDLAAGGARRSHTATGLLVGGIIGAAATTVFLIGFCSDPDTKCEADEVGRAVLFIAVPAAALGALIGSLIHTDDEES
jgi:hypothetical protein